MASREAQQLKALYERWSVELFSNPDMSIEDMRAMFERWGDLTAEPPDVAFTEVDAGGVPALWAVPGGAGEDRVVLCTHGGGYVVGSMSSHRKLFGHIARAIGCRALILDYRRAPEHPHPAPLEDTVTAYRWLLDQGLEGAHMAMTGDSAGGGLCTSAVIAIRDRGLALPGACVPISPWYDMEATGGTLETNAATDALVQRPLLEGMAGLFLGETGSKRDPLANALCADLTGLPPIYIQVGGAETLLDDTLRFEQKARAAGVEIKVDVYPEMQHVFHFLAGVAPEADTAIAQMADWVRPKLGLA